MINHQSNQLKPRKFYEYWPANANFSKLCDKGHKTKGQILLHLYGSLWTKSSGFLVFLIMSSTYCIARTLMYHVGEDQLSQYEQKRHLLSSNEGQAP